MKRMFMLFSMLFCMMASLYAVAESTTREGTPQLNVSWTPKSYKGGTVNFYQKNGDNSYTICEEVPLVITSEANSVSATGTVYLGWEYVVPLGETGFSLSLMTTGYLSDNTNTIPWRADWTVAEYDGATMSTNTSITYENTAEETAVKVMDIQPTAADVWKSGGYLPITITTTENLLGKVASSYRTTITVVVKDGA